MVDGAGTSVYTYANGLLASENGPWADDTVSYAYINGQRLDDCTLTGNSAEHGGGASADWNHPCTLNHCRLTGNTARGLGGGAQGATLHNCTLAGNYAGERGGGTHVATLYGCTLIGNATAKDGGGAGEGTLYNCTVTDNSAGLSAGGVVFGTLYNCIVYFNHAPSDANYSGATIAYSCTTPLPRGPGNIDADPQLASLTHLSAGSPCLGAGCETYTIGVDIDGEPWAIPPAMGADELVPGQVTGELSVSIQAPFTSAAAGYTLSFTALITGPLLQSEWDFGDGTIVTNQASATHAYAVPGVYAVRLTGFNDSYPAGLAASLSVIVTEGMFYVNVANPDPASPYTT